MLKMTIKTTLSYTIKKITCLANGINFNFYCFRFALYFRDIPYFITMNNPFIFMSFLETAECQQSFNITVLDTIKGKK